MKLHPSLYIIALVLIVFGFTSTDMLREYLVSKNSVSNSTISTKDDSAKTYTISQLNNQKPLKGSFKLTGFVVYVCDKCIKKRIVLSEQRVILLKDDKLTSKDIVVYTKDASDFVLNKQYTLITKPKISNNFYSLDLVKVLTK